MALVSLAVLVVGAWWAREERVLPRPAPVEAPDTAFASGRAMAELEELARTPRPVGSPEHTRVREHLVERLEEKGLEPEVETRLFVGGGRSPAGEEEPAARAVTLRNVIARIPGRDPTGAVALVAHYDGVPLSPAAGDDGVGVVTVLETVRAVLEGPPLANDLVILLTDGEEMGLLGARRFAAEHPWMDDLSVVLNLEMRGGGGPSHMFETAAHNGWIVEVMEAADPHPWARSMAVEVYRRMPHDTDFTVFREAGVQGLNFAGIHRPWVYHQPTDAVENVQEATVQHKGARVLALARELGRRDLSAVDAPDRAFTTQPGIGLVSYPQGWAFPLSLGLLAAWVGAVAVAVRRRREWWGTLAGFAGVMVTAAGTAATGWFLASWLPRFHPEFQSLASTFYGEGWYVLGLAGVAVALATGALGVARRWFAPAPVAAGAMAVPVVGAVALAWLAPLTAIELQVPAAAGILAVGAMALGGGAEHGRPPTPLAWVVVLALAPPALAGLVPVVEGLWVAGGFQAAPMLGGLLAVVVACVAPAVDGLGAPNRWWAPAGAAAMALLLVGRGIMAAGPSEERPVHSTLLYALDREENEALWATRRDPGFDWAREGVGPFVEERRLDLFRVPATYQVAPAPSVEVPEPEATVAPLAEDDGETVYRLNLRSAAGAERMSVIGAEGEGIAVVAVEGRPVDGAQGVRRLVHQGVPDEGLLAVDVRAPDEAGELPLIVVEEHFRPWEYLGEEPFRRPPHLIPSPQGRSDRALIRTPVRVPVEPPS